jgi:ferric-dicitrate binding protein FerR (iron transport regulator)
VTGEDQIGELLRLAGRRRVPDGDEMKKAREAAHAEWTLAVHHRTWRSRWRVLAGSVIAAAACVLAAWAWMRPTRVPTPVIVAPIEIATLQRITGTIEITSKDLGPRKVREPGVRVKVGDRIAVLDDSRAAFVLASGIAVRLDRGSVAIVEAHDRLALERGAAYIDSGREGGHASLRIETSLGVIRHLGTQFEVRVAAASVRVRVREGSIALERAGSRLVGSAGEALTVSDGKPPERERIATTGAEWAWIAELAEPFTLEGATVKSFLDWIGREEGWQWRIEDPALRARADRIVLHGSIEGLTPAEALDVVLPASGLAVRRVGDQLWINARR